MLRCIAVLLPFAALAQNFVDIRPSPQQIAWQLLDRERGDGTASPEVFDPTALDAGQWVKAAKTAPAAYLIVVAKHHDGFCLWPSRQTKYTVAASPYRKDVVREVSDACQEHGLKSGVYLSPWDRNAPSYNGDKAYGDYYTRQITELASRYGPITGFWLDGAGSEDHVYDFQRYIRRADRRMMLPSTPRSIARESHSAMWASLARPEESAPPSCCSTWMLSFRSARPARRRWVALGADSAPGAGRCVSWKAGVRPNEIADTRPNETFSQGACRHDRA